MEILVIDQGTTSTRAILFTPEGRVITSHQIELTQYFPQPGWVEHDPEDIWQSAKICCEKVLVQASLEKTLGLGITNQRETTVIWEKDTGKPLHKAIVWQDRRTAQYCAELKNHDLETTIYQKTGLLLDPYFSASKINWILANYPGSLERAKKGELLFGTIDSFLLWRLTGGKVHATDITNASRTSLFNIHELCWDDELLEIFSVPKQMLPVVKENCEDFSFTAKEVFKRQIPILAMMGDQQAAMIGQCCIKKGEAKCTYGTGGFLMLNTGQGIIPSDNKLLNTVAFQIKGLLNFATEGSIFAAGTIIKWFCDQLKIIQSPKETESLAMSVPDNAGVYFVPAFTGLGAPYWNPLARGSIFGLTRDSGVAHIVRAGLEAIAYQTKDLLSGETLMLKQLKVDGGLSKNNFLMQFLADILQLPIAANAMSEATALGVAYLVAISANYFKTLEQITVFSSPAKMYYPQMTSRTSKELYKGWQAAVDKTISEE